MIKHALPSKKLLKKFSSSIKRFNKSEKEASPDTIKQEKQEKKEINETLRKRLEKELEEFREKYYKNKNIITYRNFFFLVCFLGLISVFVRSSPSTILLILFILWLFS